MALDRDDDTQKGRFDFSGHVGGPRDSKDDVRIILAERVGKGNPADGSRGDLGPAARDANWEAGLGNSNAASDKRSDPKASTPELDQGNGINKAAVIPDRSAPAPSQERSWNADHAQKSDAKQADKANLGPAARDANREARPQANTDSAHRAPSSQKQDRNHEPTPDHELERHVRREPNQDARSRAADREGRPELQPENMHGRHSSEVDRLGPRLGGTDGVPVVPPHNRNDAPDSISVPITVVKQIARFGDYMIEWEKTNLGRAPEYSGTLVKDLDNDIKMRNVHNSGSVDAATEDRKILGEPDLVVIGIAHSHPDSAGNQGFSGADYANMVNSRDLIKVLTAGNKQFLLLRTGETSKVSLNPEKLQDAQLAKIIQLRQQGASEASATRITNIEMARQYGLAYYEREGGPFVRADR